MYKYKKIILVSLVFSFMFSHQYENYFNGAIPSLTKTPKKGKVSTAFSMGMERIGEFFNDNGNAELLAESRNLRTVGFQLKYHGFNGAGVELVINDNSELDSYSQFGVYYVWNEMYTDKNPAFLPWQHSYTFPMTRNVSKIMINVVDGQNYEFIHHAMDFILSSKSILSMEIGLTSDTEVVSNMLLSEFIYDLDNNFSISLGLNAYDGEDFRRTDFVLKGGYQFKNISTGNLKVNLKLVPEITHVYSGRNATKPKRNLKLNLYTYFN